MHRQTERAGTVSSAPRRQMHRLADRSGQPARIYSDSLRCLLYPYDSLPCIVSVQLYCVFPARCRRGSRRVFLLHGYSLRRDCVAGYTLPAESGAVYLPLRGGRQGRGSLRLSRNHPVPPLTGKRTCTLFHAGGTPLHICAVLLGAEHVSLRLRTHTAHPAARTVKAERQPLNIIKIGRIFKKCQNFMTR